MNGNGDSDEITAVTSVIQKHYFKNLSALLTGIRDKSILHK